MQLDIFFLMMVTTSYLNDCQSLFKPNREMLVPIIYASTMGSDEPAESHQSLPSWSQMQAKT